MKIKYSELIDQTLYFPTEEFNVSENQLQFHDIPLMEVVEKFGTPLKFNYLPKISMNIQRAKAWFKEAFELNEYTKNYRYCYCTKSSHFAPCYLITGISLPVVPITSASLRSRYNNPETATTTSIAIKARTTVW